MNQPNTAGVGGAQRRQVGEIWKDGAWFEQVAAGPWPLPTILHDDSELLFGVRVVCGELQLPLLEGTADHEEMGAARAEIKRAWHAELMEALRCDEAELRRILEGSL